MTASLSQTAEPLAAAVIGAGGISLQHLPFLQQSELVRLVGICDLSPISAEIAARRFGAESHFTDVAEMLAVSKPDVVHVLTPPQSHGFLVSMALEAGAHVICEKPMAATYGQTKDLIDKATAADRYLVENHNYRFNDEVLALRAIIDEGRIGEVREVDIRIALPVRDPAGRFGDPNVPSPIHQMPTGVLHDFITHLSYLMIEMSGVSHFERVLSALSNHGGGELFRYDDLDALLISTVDPASGETGKAIPVHGRIRFSCSTSPDLFSIVVRGDQGQVSSDIFHPHFELLIDRPGGPQLTPIVNHIVNGASLARAGLRNFGQKLLQHTPYHGLSRFLELTYSALANGEAPPVTAQNVLDAARLVDDMLAASVANQGVLGGESSGE